MISDTPARKRMALELLARSYTVKQIFDETGIKRHTIRNWKQADEHFKRKWNDLMDQLGRLIETDVDAQKEIE